MFCFYYQRYYLRDQSIQRICCFVEKAALLVQVLALPISVIGTNFTQAWMDQKDKGSRGKPDCNTPASIPLLISMMTRHASNAKDLVDKMRSCSQELQAEYVKLGFKITRLHRDCTSMINNLESNVLIKDTLQVCVVCVML